MPDVRAEDEAGMSQRLEAHVRFLSEIDPPRCYLHPDSQQRCAEYIAEQFRSIGLTPEFQEYRVDDLTFRNVIARLGPAEGPRLVVGAHYDVCGDMPGADDNASGVAGLIETARLLADTDPSVTVEFVSYPCEEPPYYGTKNMGSYRHAFALKEADVEVIAMICYEMIGYFSDARGSQNYPLGVLGIGRPKVGNYIGVAGRTQDRALVRTVSDAMRATGEIPVEHIAAPPLLFMIGMSDHRNYWKAGYNAVMICNTAFYRNKNYHTADDTADTLDYHRMAQVVRATTAAIKELATSSQPPASSR